MNRRSGVSGWGVAPRTIASRSMASIALITLIAACSRSSTKESGSEGAPSDASANASPSTTSAANANTNASAKVSANTGIHFTDVTTSSGIDMVVTCGRSPSTQLVEVKGGGIGLIDYDNDGDLDVFVPNGAYTDAPDRGPGCRMYENLGGMKFRDVTAPLGLDFHGWGMGVAVGDVDGDGFDDVYVSAYGPDVLLKNEGGKRFVDATKAAGLGDPRWSTAAAFGDVDGDGDLDLYVVNYVKYDVAKPYPNERFQGVPVFAGPVGKPNDADILYENDGHGVFRDISQASGILDVPPSSGLGVAIFDADGDGKQDVFVGNDSMANFLLVNQGGNRFVDMGARTGIGTNGDGAAQATMGIAIGDVNGDGKPDVFTTNFANDTNTLHVSAKDGFFFGDRTSQYGLGQISRPYLKWATGFFDFDHDGDEDLVVFDGHVYPNATREAMDSTYRQTPLLFERKERFERVDAARAGAWLAEEHVDRSAAFGDLDGDGDVDMIVTAVNERLRVLRNDVIGAAGATSAPWLVVELVDARSNVGNRHARGAKLTLTTGDKTQARWNFSGGGYQASSSPYAHFGLPSARESTLDVTWPDGAKQRVEHVAPNQRLVVKRP